MKVSPMKDRRIYIDRMPLEKALPLFLNAVAVPSPIPTETVPVEESLGRITGAPLHARVSSPHYHAAAMDGAAVRSQDTVGAGEGHPLTLKMGQEAFYLDTGDPLPEGTDAVIMIENIQPHGKDAIEIMASVAPWQHVRTMGEDIVASQLILPPGHRIRPHDVGALLAGGLTHIPVRRRPRVVVIPTGTELVQPGSPLKPGDIIETNSRMLGNFAREWGAEWVPHPIVRDDYESLKAAVSQAVKSCDVVVVNAGSSAGSEDYTVHVFEELGEVLQHGVGIAPGQPTILGVISGKPVMGCPGFPVSAAVIFVEFMRPLLARLLGVATPQGVKIRATVARKLPSKLGLLDLVRVKVGRVNGRAVALPLSRGASLTTSLAEADGVIRIPQNSEGIEQGREVEVELFRDPHEIEGNILFTGSHDMALDLLATSLREESPGTTLSKAPMGSLDGLLALKRGEAHLAGSHLLDPETGEYNFPTLRKYFEPGQMTVVQFVYRQQGLIVPSGNPKGIKSVEDLVRPDVQFINRQRGAGTRALLEHKLGELGLDPRRISGYHRIATTHMALAAAVVSRSADVGLGVLAAAMALGLDFIPVGWERYDLVIPRDFLELSLLRPLLQILRTPAFQKKVEAMGGYSVARMGDLLEADPGPFEGGSL